jgi:hypothetical protein
MDDNLKCHTTNLPVIGRGIKANLKIKTFLRGVRSPPRDVKEIGEKEMGTELGSSFLWPRAR